MYPILIDILQIDELESSMAIVVNITIANSDINVVRLSSVHEIGTISSPKHIAISDITVRDNTYTQLAGLIHTEDFIL